MRAEPATNYAAGSAAFGRADYSEATRLFSLVIAESRPPSWYLRNGYLMRGLSYFRAGEDSLALLDYDRAFEIGPADAVLHYDRGLARHHAGDDAGALADYREALRLNPGYADVYDDRALIELSNNDLESAMSDLERAVALDPKNPRHRGNRGEVYQRRGQFDRAIADYAAAAEMAPDDFLPRAHLGDAAYAAGDYRAAIVRYTEALDRPLLWHSVFVSRGNVHRRLEDFEAARADYRHAARFRDSAPFAEFELGLTEVYAGNPSGALAPLAYAARYAKQSHGREYATLWQMVALLHLGSTPQGEALRTLAEPFASANWPGPMFEMFLGNRSVDSTIAAATSADPTGTGHYACEARYYGAELQFALGRKRQAVDLLQSDVARCRVELVEYEAAARRLASL